MNYLFFSISVLLLICMVYIAYKLSRGIFYIGELNIYKNYEDYEELPTLYPDKECDLMNWKNPKEEK